MQVIGEVHVPGSPGHQRKAGGNENSRHNRQTIKPVGQVYGVTRTDDDKVGQQNVKQPQLRHNIFKERHHQLGRGRVFPDEIKRKGHAERDNRHPEIFPARNQPFGIFPHHFAIVIDKTDNAVADQYHQSRTRRTG